MGDGIIIPRLETSCLRPPTRSRHLGILSALTTNAAAASIAFRIYFLQSPTRKFAGKRSNFQNVQIKAGMTISSPSRIGVLLKKDTEQSLHCERMGPEAPL